MEKLNNLPRGLRNCNPLNIRHSKDKFWGELPPEQQTDSAFKQFKDMSYGYRAAFKVLATYINVYGLRNLNLVIERFAPDSDGANHSGRYIEMITSLTAIQPYDELSIYNRNQACSLVSAMSYVENGIVAEWDSVCFGYDLFIEGSKRF